MYIIGHKLNESYQIILSYIFVFCVYILMKESFQTGGKKI